MRRLPSDEDRKAAWALIGCEMETGENGTDVVLGGGVGNPCPWEGIVEVQYHNADGPTWRSCREHAVMFRKLDDYRVADSGSSNQRMW